MKIVATADLHGAFPNIPECDLLLIAGDVCPVDRDHSPAVQRHWMRTEFAPWLDSLPAKEIVWIGGNHDFICQQPGFSRLAEEMPGHYLMDSSVKVFGLKVYGFPWVPNLPQWAFYADDPALQSAAQRIPEGIDILLSHGPPFGILDQVHANHVGAAHIMSRLQKVLPKFVVFGHIHEGYGRMELGGVEFKNVSHMNELYEPVNPPQTFKVSEPPTVGLSRYCRGMLELARLKRKQHHDRHRVN